MDSNELNKQVRAICEAKEHPYVAFGGKPIPFIGWWWRSVDWDAEMHWLGVIPSECNDGGPPLVGFMENNKWGYPEIEVYGTEWACIRQLVEAAALEPTADNLRAVDRHMQGLIAGQHDKYRELP